MTYVYENIEVEKTGRTAQRKLKSGRTDELVEIKPVEEVVGKWRRWVREADLFEVGEQNG